jgi:hypothetical protein
MVLFVVFNNLNVYGIVGIAQTKWFCSKFGAVQILFCPTWKSEQV